MSARIAAGLVALTLLAGCSTSRSLSDPRLQPPDPVILSPSAETIDAEADDDLAVVREAEELVGTQDDAAGYLDGRVERGSVLVDTLSDGELRADVPDISDSLAAATEARLPSVEEIFDYPVVVNRRVLTWIDVYTGHSRGSFQNTLRRSGRYLPMARRIFAEEGIPQDLAFLGYVESGFRFNARSPARALGLWQFMRGTARDLGLRCDDRVDERLDPEKSTRACARYLKQLYERYDDWILALAAYNTGPGNVDKALKRTGSRDFWEIARSGHLLHETRNFVPAILAATILAKSPSAYGFSEEADPPLVYDTIHVDHPADLRIIGRCAGCSEEELRALNPGLIHAQTPGSARYEVHVPLGSGPQTAARVAEIPPADLIAFVNHKVRSGDTLGGVAKRYGSSVRAIQETNGMGRSTLIRVGRTLRVPSGGASAGNLAARDADGSGAGGSTDPAGTHTVRSGETVSSIALRHGVTVNAIVRANRLIDPARIRPGQTLEIPGTSSATQEAAAPGSGTVESVAAGNIDRTQDRGARPSAGSAGPGTDPAVPAGRGISLSLEQVAAAESEFPTVVDTAAILGRVASTAHLVDQARAELEGDPAAPESAPVSPALVDAPKLHVVVSGDTLWQIARSYGVAVSDLVRWNGLRARARIYPGQRIKVY